jgi:predicted esterase
MMRSIGLVLGLALALGTHVGCSDAGSGAPRTEPALDAGVDMDAMAVDAVAVDAVDAQMQGRDGAPADAGGDAATVKPGTGGAGGIVCDSMRTVSGRPVCVANAMGSEFRFVQSANPVGPQRLVVYVHGDGARAYESDGALKALLGWSDAHQALTVAVRAPNKCAWWQKASQTDCSDTAKPDPDGTGANADVLKAVLDALRARYDIALGPTFFYGSSGGSIFLSYSFLRRFGDLYPGAYALNCGASKPSAAFAWDTQDRALRDPTKLYFTYGDKDFLKPDIEKAIPFFQMAGFFVDQKVIPNADHCAFDGHGRAQEVFSAYLGQ